MKQILPLLLLVWACGGTSEPSVVVVQGRNGELARYTIKDGVRNGAALIHDSAKRIKRSGEYQNGLKDGEWRVLRNDTLEQILPYSKGRFHGLRTTFWANGNTATSVELKKGVAHGTMLVYYENSQIKRDIQFRNGKRHGPAKGWNLLADGTYSHTVGQFCADKNCGIWKNYHPNGQLAWQVRFENSKKEGPMPSWDKSGTALETKIYKNNKLIDTRPAN